MSCPSPSTTPRPKWGFFLSTIELLLYCMTCIKLFVFEISTHLCTLNIIVFGVVFLCITINYWLGWYLTLLCANIMPKFSFLSSRRPFFSGTVLMQSVAILICTATV
jgi:hypothetical protein